MFQSSSTDCTSIGIFPQRIRCDVVVFLSHSHLKFLFFPFYDFAAPGSIKKIQQFFAPSVPHLPAVQSAAAAHLTAEVVFYQNATRRLDLRKEHSN